MKWFKNPLLIFSIKKTDVLKYKLPDGANIALSLTKPRKNKQEMFHVDDGAYLWNCLPVVSLVWEIARFEKY